MWPENCFITLTYSPEHLPNPPSLDVTHFQKFMKRLRKKYEPKTIRFFHCGEYGERNNRPHYHALLFNHDFEDKRLWQKSSSGALLYTSEDLQSLWPYGFSSLGAATFQSAAYVARYIMKKVTGEPASEHYEYADPETGELFPLCPEYVTMSRRPGLGRKWLQKYQSDVWPDDFVVLEQKKHRPPRFYDQQVEAEDAIYFRKVKGERKRKAKKHEANNTVDRLKVREQVQLARLNKLERKI